MAYNPNMFMPQYQGYQNYPANYMAQVQQQPVNGLVSVTGIEGAKAYQLPPNSSMPLFDANSDILYLKTTDGAGFPTVRAFKFEEVGTETKAQPEYATRADLEALAARVEELAPKQRTRKAAQDAE